MRTDNTVYSGLGNGYFLTFNHGTISTSSLPYRFTTNCDANAGLQNNGEMVPIKLVDGNFTASITSSDQELRNLGNWCVQNYHKITLRNTSSSSVTVYGYVGANTGKLTLNAKNLTTGKTYTLSYSNDLIRGTPCLISSVSYVPHLSGNSPITPDYRCGGYFRNVIQSESKVYTSGGTAYDFYSKSNKTQYSLRYNTDCCDLTSGSSRDIIDIFYDRAYRT